MKIGEAVVLLPNAVCGIMISVIVLLKGGSELAIVLLSLSMLFLAMDYANEWLKRTRKEFGPYSPPSWDPEAERIRSIILFSFNLAVFFIFWFEPVVLPAEAHTWDMVTVLLIYGGFPTLILKWDFGKLGTELARHRLNEENPD